MTMCNSVELLNEQKFIDKCSWKTDEDAKLVDLVNHYGSIGKWF